MRLILMLMIIGLSACQSTGVNDDHTGDLGTIIDQKSPAEIYVQLASEYLRLGDYQSALIKAKKAVRKDEDYSNAHLIMALIYEKLEQNDLANRAYQQAIAKDRNNAYALNAYGSYLCKIKAYEKSLNYFERAVKNPLYPTPWIPLSNAGLCAKQAGNIELAEFYLRRALQKEPNFAPALAQMAEIKFNQQDYLAVRAYIQRLRDIAPLTPKLLYLSILSERALGNEDQARSDELMLFSEFPESEEAQKLKNGL